MTATRARSRSRAGLDASGPKWKLARAGRAHGGISQDGVLRAVAPCAGLDPDGLLEEIASVEVGTRLRANAGERIERGGFGWPAFFVDGDDTYFGNDRLPLVREAPQRRAGPAAGRSAAGGDAPR